MTHSILLGAREDLNPRTRASWLYQTWLPVAIVLAVICRESTNTFSAEVTAGWIRHTAEFVFGPIANVDWARVNHVGSKTGHFLWYGITGLSWLRAWLLTWLAPMRKLRTAVWRGYAVTLAVFCTIACASLDELHQSFIPSRTGLVSDIWLDTSGAAVLIACVALTWIRRTPPAYSGRVQE